MIRRYKESDLSALMQIWVDSNIEVHSFIPAEYWTDNFAAVKAALPMAEIYVHEDDDTKRADGFIGLNGEYIEGIFVEGGKRSMGIGKQLLDHVKKLKDELNLSVYRKNFRALSFYQRECFAVQSESMDSDTGEAEVLMRWQI